MAIAHSPLRYPGGKQVLTRVLSHLMKLNGVHGGTYAEPFAGGAGAAISLLFGEHVDRVLINDADLCIYAFWNAALYHTERFLKLLRTTPTTVCEWERQRAIYQQPKRHSTLRVGFATFYLNRCNRSGIIGNGGPIGGKRQTGKWKIDARFNRKELERRITRIALYRDRVSVSQMDGIEFLKRHVTTLDERAKAFVYLDPPYYAKGCDLYLNHYKPEDHAKLAAYLKNEVRFDWVLSYDNVPEIKRLYAGLRRVSFKLDYSARERRVGSEIMILKSGLAFPDRWKRTIPQQYVTASDNVSIPVAG